MYVCMDGWMDGWMFLHAFMYVYVLNIPVDMTWTRAGGNKPVYPTSKL